jgi:hypothetical protein
MPVTVGPEAPAPRFGVVIQIKVRAVGPQHTAQLVLVQDEEGVEAFAPHAAVDAFTDGVRAWRLHGRPQHRDATPRRAAGERRPVLMVIVADQETRAGAKRRGLTQVLGDPCNKDAAPIDLSGFTLEQLQRLVAAS